MRRDTPVLPGLIASAVLHAFIVLLNPAMQVPSNGVGGRDGLPSGPATQFTVLSLARDGEAAIRLDALPPAAAVTAPPFTPDAGPADVRESGRPEGAEAGTQPTVAERLRYNTQPFSPQVRETWNERAIREARERVFRAGAELGPLPPNRVVLPQGGGIRIPFGPGPPGPAVTVPAPPLPDSILRRDSMRAAIRAAARRDSIRAARADTMRLKNVAPRRRREIPRIRPDTTSLTVWQPCDESLGSAGCASAWCAVHATAEVVNIARGARPSGERGVCHHGGGGRRPAIALRAATLRAATLRTARNSRPRNSSADVMIQTIAARHWRRSSGRRLTPSTRGGPGWSANAWRLGEGGISGGQNRFQNQPSGGGLEPVLSQRWVWSQ